jgi:hypothetical protein
MLQQIFDYQRLENWLLNFCKPFFYCFELNVIIGEIIETDKSLNQFTENWRIKNI